MAFRKISRAASAAVLLLCVLGAAAAQAADVILLDPSAVHLAAALKACSRAPLVYDHEPAAYAQAGIFELADYCVPGRASVGCRLYLHLDRRRMALRSRRRRPVLQTCRRLGDEG